MVGQLTFPALLYLVSSCHFLAFEAFLDVLRPLPALPAHEQTGRGVREAAFMVVVFASGALNHLAQVVPLVAFLANPKLLFYLCEVEGNFAFVVLQNGVDLGKDGFGSFALEVLP